MSALTLGAGRTVAQQTPHQFSSSEKRFSYTNDRRLDGEISEIFSGAEQRISQSWESSARGPVKTEPQAAAPWWEKESAQSIDETGRSTRSITLENLFIEALEHSTQIRVFSDVPLIRETSIQEAEGVFDTRAFVQSVYEYTNDPITTLLETGQESGRFEQNAIRHQGGLRQRTGAGTEITLALESNYLDNNSEFLTPNPQTTSRLRLAIVQPIFKGAGFAYNRAIIDIAQLDTDAALQEHLRQAESHLLEITRAYWTLSFARIAYLRKQKYFNQANSIAEELQAREDLDAIEGQISRARSAVAFRNSEMVRARMEVLNAQDRIRTLVNSPELGALNTIELIPTDPIITERYPVSFQQSARRALRQRPEIQQAMLQIRAAAVRERIARNEVLPQLNLILEGYVAGVAADNNFGTAWNNQFSDGRPGWLAGFSFEFPLGNHTAKAKRLRRQLEVRQQFNQLRTTIDTVLLEVQASVREVETAFEDYQAKHEAMKAAEAEFEQFTARREVDTAPDAAALRSQSWYLDEWLNTQARLEFAEQEFARVATIYQVALVNLERAQGNLLLKEQISVVRDTDEDRLPLLRLEKQTRPSTRSK
ncbi:MAG: TolC family protein [Verrucomicrobiales bacterium]